MSSTRELSVNEIVATLSHSSKPCLLVEGRDDMAIYRLIAERAGVDIMPCGGRNNLFSVYSQRHKFAKNNVIFFADKDMFVFEGIPEEYSDIIFTHGYSIENDVLSCPELFAFYNENELHLYEAFLNQLSLWWARELFVHYSGGAGNLASHILATLNPLPKSKIMPSDICYTYQRLSSPSQDAQVSQTSKIVKDNFSLCFRGHSLLQIHKFIFSNKPEKCESSLSRGLLIMLARIGHSSFLKNDVNNISFALNNTAKPESPSWTKTLVSLPFCPLRRHK